MSNDGTYSYYRGKIITENIPLNVHNYTQNPNYPSLNNKIYDNEGIINSYNSYQIIPNNNQITHFKNFDNNYFNENPLANDFEENIPILYNSNPNNYNVINNNNLGIESINIPNLNYGVIQNPKNRVFNNSEIKLNDIKNLNIINNHNIIEKQEDFRNNKEFLNKEANIEQSYNYQNNYPENKINNEIITNINSPNVIEIANNYTDFQSNKTETQIRPLKSNDFDRIYLTGVGMINLGNTCFINASLQILIHCKLFIHKFFDKYSIINKEKTPISYQFLLLCIAMLNIKNNEEKYIDISNFKEEFGKKHPRLGDYSQNDSQEFVRLFLEDLSMELNEAKNKNVYRALTNTEGKTKKFRDEEFNLNFQGREESIITKLFYSQILTSFTCQCGSEIYSFQKIMDFPLLLPVNISEINIYYLLKMYFKSELIDFETKCQRCNQITKRKKTMKISRPPKILIISLQRINEIEQKKNECIVNFPEYLNLAEFIDHELDSEKEFEYKLFSVVNHQGTVDCGHYFAYIQPFGLHHWFEFNDSSVRHVKEDLKIFPYAYALFYINKKYSTI